MRIIRIIFSDGSLADVEADDDVEVEQTEIYSEFVPVENEPSIVHH